MKKMLLFLVIILCGCKDPLVENTKESLDNIDYAKYETAKQSTIELINSAETKYLMDMYEGLEKDCYSAIELSSNSTVTSGEVCYQNNDYVARNILVNGYICNGSKLSVVCEEVND